MGVSFTYSLGSAPTFSSRAFSLGVQPTMIANFRFDACPIYFVTDHGLNAGREKVDVVEAALKGGVGLVQYRDKELSDADFEAEARRILSVCRSYGVPLLINDRLDIAHRIKADGIHLGQGDISPVEARRLLGEGAIIGLSTHNEAEALQAQALPLSYINIGPMFPTATKTLNDYRPLGADEVIRIGLLSHLPYTTMGGIKRHHLQTLFSQGVRTVAMVTEISLAEDIAATVRDLLEEINSAGVT